MKKHTIPTNIEEKARMIEKPEVPANIQESKMIIRSNKNIVWLEYNQGIIFRKFKQREKFTNMIGKFGVSRSTILFNISIVNLTEEFLKMKKTL